MNEPYHRYRRDEPPWDDDASRSSRRPHSTGGGREDFHRHRSRYESPAHRHSSAYERARISPFRQNTRSPQSPQHHPNNGYSSDGGSVGSEEGPTYLLEHLATFRVSGENDLVYPADGLRRLLHMEKTTGIWTQKMLLRLEKKWVYILSHENGDVVERFPMELIREPTAFTSNDPKELYNNIFIFIVAEDPKRKYHNPTEMNIFQCLRVSANVVVEDMELYMSGKGIEGKAAKPVKPRERASSLAQETAPETPVVSNGFRDFSDEARAEPLMSGPRSERSSLSHGDDVSSTSSEKCERDISILNSCFDDIERFIARLHYTAVATKELEKRQRSRKSKKKDIGDGILSMRAKPPPEREFVDIFQKFKLSFNLLAKVRAHIHNPNAPELVHFLFTPLGLITDASRNTYGPNLPAKIVSPLLTRDTLDFLSNCLTSQETELWHSLGDPWLIPREVWKYPAPPYQPVFASGWAPELADEARTELSETKLRQRETEMRRAPRHEDISEIYDSDRRDSSPPLRYGHRSERPGSLTPPSEYPQHMEASSFEKQQKQWLNELISRGAKVVQVTYPRTANNDKELSVERGEYLEIVDDSRKWWKAINCKGQMAHVPHTIVTPYSPDQDPGPEIRRTVSPPSSDWVRREKQGKKVGQPSLLIPPPPPLPTTSVVPTSASSISTNFDSENSQEELFDAVNGKMTLSTSSDEDVPHVISQKSVPKPPPPPPDTSQSNTFVGKVPREKPATSTQMYGTTKSQADLMNEELKVVLETFKKRRPNIDITKTPDVYINQKSSPDEVQQWLQMKGFSEKICKQFDGVNGEKIFSLSRKQLENYFGKTEGQRLDSQLTVQRNISGFKTARTMELRSVLAERRKKIESSSSKTDDDVTEDFSFLKEYDQSEEESENDDHNNNSISRSVKGVKQNKEMININ